MGSTDAYEAAADSDQAEPRGLVKSSPDWALGKSNEGLGSLHVAADDGWNPWLTCCLPAKRKSMSRLTAAWRLSTWQRTGRKGAARPPAASKAV
jgi:hypothetical protein